MDMLVLATFLEPKLAPHAWPAARSGVLRLLAAVGAIALAVGLLRHAAG